MLGPGHLTDSLEVLQCLGGKEDLREQVLCTCVTLLGMS